jgi:hypothetical protein
VINSIEIRRADDLNGEAGYGDAEIDALQAARVTSFPPE